jgi:hypothetical protein
MMMIRVKILTDRDDVIGWCNLAVLSTIPWQYRMCSESRAKFRATRFRNPVQIAPSIIDYDHNETDRDDVIDTFWHFSFFGSRPRAAA